MPRRRKNHGIGTQIKVVGTEVARGPVGRSARLGGLQCRLDHAGHATRHFVLKIEDIFERAVEAVGPEMRAAGRIDQLSGDAHAPAGFTYRAFEHIAHTQFAPDLLQIDRLAFVSKTRIAGAHEQPTDAAECGDDLFNHAVGEIFLLRVAAQIGKRQHRQ